MDLLQKNVPSHIHTKFYIKFQDPQRAPKPIHIILMPQIHVVQVLGSCVEEEISKRAKKTLRKSNQEEFNCVIKIHKAVTRTVHGIGGRTDV